MIITQHDGLQQFVLVEYHKEGKEIWLAMASLNDVP